MIDFKVAQLAAGNVQNKYQLQANTHQVSWVTCSACVVPTSCAYLGRPGAGSAFEVCHQAESAIFKTIHVCWNNGPEPTFFERAIPFRIFSLEWIAAV